MKLALSVRGKPGTEASVFRGPEYEASSISEERPGTEASREIASFPGPLPGPLPLHSFPPCNSLYINTLRITWLVGRLDSPFGKLDTVRVKVAAEVEMTQLQD